MVAGGVMQGVVRGGLLRVCRATDLYEDSSSLESSSLSAWRGGISASHIDSSELYSMSESHRGFLRSGIVGGSGMGSASVVASMVEAELTACSWRGRVAFTCCSIRLGRSSLRAWWGIILVTGYSGIGGRVG
jgi:hypothetical protein